MTQNINKPQTTLLATDLEDILPKMTKLITLNDKYYNAYSTQCEKNNNFVLNSI